MKRKALGKGLRSLIPDKPRVATPPPAARTRPAGDGLQQIDIDRIQPNRGQPREDFDAAALEELARSLAKDGVLQPVIVRPARDGRYELIAGERRWRAAQIAGLLKVPVVIRDVADERLLELALIENLQREQLNPIEEASAFQTLIDDLGLTQEEVAERVGKPRSTVANSLRLLNLPRDVQTLVRGGQLSAGHAKALAAVTNSRAQSELAARAVAEGLSVRQVESLVARAGSRGGARGGGVDKPRDPNVAAAEERLQSALGTKVRIVAGRKGGRLELHYFGSEELERLYDLLIRATTA